MNDLTGQIECTTESICKGGFGSVYKGRWVEEAVNAERPQIVVKVMNFPPPVDKKQKDRQSRQIKRQLELWSKIHHKNILPLLGTANINDIPAFITPLMKNGNAKQFRSRYPDFPALGILHDVIQGLHYLHTFEPEIVHGDIKATNVLINDRYEARLCDFGLSRFLVDDELWRETDIHAGGSLRWMSPELITGTQSTSTKESDIYAYAMTCYEILSGDVPFKSVRNDAQLIYSVTIAKQRPELVESCGLDDIWAIITNCWAEEPEDRPRTAEVLEALELVRKRISNDGVVYLETLDRVPDQDFLKTFLGLLVGRCTITSKDSLGRDDAMLMDISRDELEERLHEMRSILRFEPFIDVHHRSFLEFLQDSSRSGQCRVTRSAGTRRYMELMANLLIRRAAADRLTNHGIDHFAPEFGKLIKRNPHAIELDVEEWEQTLRPLLNALDKLLVPSNIDFLMDRYCQQCQFFQITYDILTHFKSLRKSEDPVVEKCLKSLEEIILYGNPEHQIFDTNFRPVVFGSAAIAGILMAILAH